MSRIITKSINTLIFICVFIISFNSLSQNNSSIQQIKQHKNHLNDISPYIKYSKKTIAFTNATLIDGTGNDIKRNQTIIVENGLFKALGSTNNTAIPKEILTINLNGKTVIPGIIGMHNHLHIPGFPYVGDIAAKLYLANGVTTIQTCGAASPYKELELAKKIALGKHIGPDIIPSAPFITGEGGNPNMIIPKNENHLKDTMQHWINQGVKWFKVYRNTHPNDLKIIIDEAHKNNAKVRGHLCSITFEEAAKLGIDAIEHGLNSMSDFRTGKNYGICNGDRKYIDSLDLNSDKVHQLLQLLVQKKVFLTSTLSIFEASIPNRIHIDNRTLEIMSPYLKSQYKENKKELESKKQDFTRNKRLKRIMQLEYQYYKMGGLVCAGVDAGRHVLPGFGDQRNYELLLEAGFSVEQAIQIMTGNGARALEINSIGTIELGKTANFVILNGDLENNATIIKNVETVFKNGIGYNPIKILNDNKGKFGLE